MVVIESRSQWLEEKLDLYQSKKLLAGLIFGGPYHLSSLCRSAHQKRITTSNVRTLAK